MTKKALTKQVRMADLYVVNFKATMFLFSVLDEKILKIWWGRAVEKNTKEKTLDLWFGKVNAGVDKKKT